MNNYCVYIHRNKINDKIYIGMTGQSPEQRWQKGKHYKTCPYFYNAIEKYGWDNFEHIIFMNNLTFSQAEKIEHKLILLFNAQNSNIGYNIKSGGSHGKHAAETKEKIRLKALGRTQSKQQRSKISEKVKGDKNPRALKVMCLNTGQIFNTAKEAAQWCNRDNSCLSKCAKGKMSYCGLHPVTKEKLHWKYLDKTEDINETH